MKSGFPCGINNESEEGIPQLRPMNIDNYGQINLTSVKYVKTNYEISRYYVKNNDIIFNNTNSHELVGKTALWKKESDEYVLSNHMTILRLSRDSGLEPPFLARYFHYLWSNGYFSHIRRPYVNQAGVDLNKLREVVIPMPHPRIQRRIMAILDKAEDTRRLRAKAEELASSLLQSIFLEMFDDPSRNPNSWEIKRIDEVAERITDGEHITPIRTNEGIYLLSARNIQNHKVALENVDFIGEEEYERISKRILPQKGDILISCSGTIGRIARVKDNYRFQMVRSVALIRPKNNIIHPIFLEYFFDTIFMKNQIEKSVNQSSQANLFQGKIQKLLILIPPMNLQSEFARIAEKIESLISRIDTSESEIDDLFSIIMQKTFRGELIA